jgi:hypothetical protein
MLLTAIILFPFLLPLVPSDMFCLCICMYVVFVYSFIFWIYLPHENKQVTFVFLNLAYFTNMISSSTHFPENDIILFIFMAEQNSIVYIYLVHAKQMLYY